uniref:CSON008554 protein n=1 Tax=Culicoides sonorensis TaxID=179676 RepID=A0A336N7Y1_CULSO
MSSVPSSISFHRTTSKTNNVNGATTTANVQVHHSQSKSYDLSNGRQNGNNNCNGQERVQQLNRHREIPEENLLTLGTLRYGIRLSSSPRITERRSMSFPSSITTNSTSSSSLSRLPSSASSAQTSSLIQNGVNKDKDCCCIGASSLPWMHHSHGEHHHYPQNHHINGSSGNNMTRSTKLPMPSNGNEVKNVLYDMIQLKASTVAKNRIISQSNNSSNYPLPQITSTTAHHPQYLNHPHLHSQNSSNNNLSSLIPSCNRETSPPTVCCYNNSSRESSNTLNRINNNNNNNVSINSSNNQSKSNLVRYNSVSSNSSRGSNEKRENSRKNCDNLINLTKNPNKIRVKSDPCLGGLSVNLVQINGEDNDKGKSYDENNVDGKNHHKLLLLSTKSISGSSYTSNGSGVSAINKNRNTAAAATTTVLCKPTDYSNNFCVNNNNSKSNNNNDKTKVNSCKNRTKSELPLFCENSKNTTSRTSEKLENLNLLNCFTSKLVRHSRDSRSSSVCLDGSSSIASENSLNTSLLSEDLSTDVSVSSSLRKSNNNYCESQKSSLTSNSNVSRNDSIKSSASAPSSINKVKYSSKNGSVIHKLLPPPGHISLKKSTEFSQDAHKQSHPDIQNKQIINKKLNEQINNFNYIDCSSSGEISLSDDSHINRPLPPPPPQTTTTASPKRSFLHTIPTVSSPLLSLSNETSPTINNQTIDFNQHDKGQIKIKEFYEQKTLSTAADLHKFKSNTNNINQHQHIRYKTIATEYPNIGYENYQNSHILYESITMCLIIQNNKKVPATVPRNNSTKSLRYYQTQQINGDCGNSNNSNIGNINRLNQSQQDIQNKRGILCQIKLSPFGEIRII